METRIIEIEYKDGSKFRVFCANKSQINRTIKAIVKSRDLILKYDYILNGLHTVEQFEKIAEQKVTDNETPQTI